MARCRTLILAVAIAGGCREGDEEELACIDASTIVDDGSAQALQASFRAAAAKASPAVVSVFSTKTITLGAPHGARPGDPGDDFLRDLPFPHPGRFQQTGLGSGFVLDDDGHVLTSYHIIAGADEIKVQLSDAREVEAKVVGVDPPTDLALLRIDAPDLPEAELGDSDALKVGDWVLAIGDPFGLPQTVSAGIVSAKGRADVGIVEFEDFIQTDAAVNPGNSGGPLVDVDGRVVGINTAIATRSGGSAGIAFAIPSNMAVEIARDLRDRGKVIRGHLGVVLSAVPDGVTGSLGIDVAGGLLVQDVVTGSAAQAAGLRIGDIITRLDGREVASTAAFRVAIAGRKPGRQVSLEVWRAGETETLDATLEEASAPPTPPDSTDLSGLLGERSLPHAGASMSSTSTHARPTGGALPPDPINTRRKAR